MECVEKIVPTFGDPEWVIGLCVEMVANRDRWKPLPVEGIPRHLDAYSPSEVRVFIETNKDDMREAEAKRSYRIWQAHVAEAELENASRLETIMWGIRSLRDALKENWAGESKDKIREIHDAGLMLKLWLFEDWSVRECPVSASECRLLAQKRSKNYLAMPKAWRGL